MDDWKNQYLALYFIKYKIIINSVQNFIFLEIDSSFK